MLHRKWWKSKQRPGRARASSDQLLLSLPPFLLRHLALGHGSHIENHYLHHIPFGRSVWRAGSTSLWRWRWSGTWRCASRSTTWATSGRRGATSHPSSSSPSSTTCPSSSSWGEQWAQDFPDTGLIGYSDTLGTRAKCHCRKLSL